MISVKQLSYLIAAEIFSTGILYLPSISLKQSGNGGWLSPFFSLLAGIIVILVLTFLYQKYPSKTLTDYLPQLVGNVGAKIIGALYVLFFWDCGLDVVREIVGVVQATLLPHTPVVAICFAISFSIIYALYCGLESLARFIELIYFSMPALVIILTLGVAGAIHSNAYFPMLDAGWSGVFRGAFVPSSWFGEVVILAYLLPEVSNSSKVLSRLLWTLVVTAGLLSIMTLLIIGVLGTSEAARTQLASFEVMRYVQFGTFLQHIDALFLLPWLMLMLIKGILFFYVAVVSFSQTAKLSKPKILIIPLVFLSIVISHWLFSDEFTISKFLEIVWPNYSLFFEVLVPILLWITYLIRQVLTRKQNATP